MGELGRKLGKIKFIPKRANQGLSAAWSGDAWVGLAAVKSAYNLFLQSVGFHRVFDFNHSPGQFTQFVRGKQTVAAGFCIIKLSYE
jgi:hypothetical protein